MAVPNLLTWAQGLIKMPEYSSRIPQAVRDNITALGYYIQSEKFDPTAITPFLSGMLTKVGKQLVEGFQWDDDIFSTFYKGEVPVGGFIENDFIGITGGEAYPKTLTDGQTVDPFVINKPSVAVSYFAVNFGMQYWVTIADEQLSTAVISNETLANFVMESIGVLAKSWQLDKYLAVREMFGAAPIYGVTDTITITSTGDSFSENEAIEILQHLKSRIKAIRKPQTQYNVRGVVNGMKKSDQVLIINGVVWEMVKAALRKTFHNETDLDVDEIIEVDGFGTKGAEKGLYASIVSRQAVKLYDKQSQRSNNIFNPRGEYWNHYLKGWGWIGYADVAPACAFTLVAAPAGGDAGAGGV